MRYRLLVVEDNQANLEMLRDWLESEDFEVLIARNLETARQAVQGIRLDIVLLDVSLGAEDGLDLVRWMRQDPGAKPIPVIAVTAHAMAHERERALQAGCNSFVSKPIDLRRLRQQLRLWLRVG